MNKFTAGPWKVDDRGDSFDITGPNFAWIAVVQGSREEDEYDAALIAAAPDLYAACRAALDRMAGIYANTFDSRMDNDPLVIQLRDALRVAEGGQQ